MIILRSYELLQNLFTLSDSEFIVGLYHELLEESPENDLVTYYLECMNVGFSKFDILNCVVRSKPFEQKMLEPETLLSILCQLMSLSDYKFIEECNSQILSITLSVNEIVRKVDALHEEKSKTEFLIKTLLDPKCFNQTDISSSSGFQNDLWELFSLNSSEFIPRIFKELMNREATKEECKILSAYSPYQIYQNLVKSFEFGRLLKSINSNSHLQYLRKLIQIDNEGMFLAEIYRECLSREPDSKGYESWLKCLKNGIPKIDVLRNFMLSDEAYNRYIEFDKKTKNNISQSINLWPTMEIDKEFRAYVQNSLISNKFPFSTNILVCTGGIGDFIQMTVVAKALKTKDPNQPVVLIISHSHDMFDEHPYIDLVLNFARIDNHKQVVKSIIGVAENVFDLHYVSRAYGSIKPTKYFNDNEWYYAEHPQSDVRMDDLGKHVCDLALISLGLDSYASCNDTLIVPDENIEIISKDYVVVCDNVGIGPAIMKCWVDDEWNSLIGWLIENGLTPVQLGTKSNKLLHPKVIDLRGKTTVRQAAAYLKYSKAYIGIEGGLFHVAKAVHTPSVVIFATTSEVCFSYPDTIAVSKRLCRPCWWTEPFLHSKCMRGCKSCLNLPSWEMLAEQIAKLLNL